jgi:hypothetical protein
VFGKRMLSSVILGVVGGEAIYQQLQLPDDAIA